MNVAAGAIVHPQSAPIAGPIVAGHQRDLRLIVGAYLALAGAMIALRIVASGGLAELAYLVTSALPVVALVAGPRLMRTARPRPWYLLAAGQAAFLVGDLILGLDQTRSIPAISSAADASYLLAYPLLAAGVLSLIRERLRKQSIALLDATVIGVACALVLWVVRIDHIVADHSLALGSQLVTLAFPIGDVLLVAAAAYLVLNEGTRTALSGRLLLASLAMLLGADLISARATAASSLDATTAALWMLGYVVMGAAALVPSMTRLAMPDLMPKRKSRTLMISVVSLAAIPIFVTLDQLFDTEVELIVIVVASVAVVGALLLRIQLLVRAELDEKVRYAHLLENASDAFAVVAPDGLITFCSPASERLLGYQPGDFLGHRITQLVRLVHPADAATRGRVLFQVIQEPGRTAMFDIRLRHRDGSYRWLSVTATNRTADTAVAGIVLNGHDVTAEHEADDQLRLQASILGNITEAVIATDLQGRTTHWNAGATAIYGYAADEMLGTSLARVYPNQSEEALAADIATIGDGADFLGEWGGKRKDGSDVWVDIRTTVLRDAHGKAYGVVGVSRDVTVERATRRHLVRLQTAIENTSEAILVVGREGRVEYVNPGFETMTGFVASREIGVEGWLMSGAPEIGGPWSAIGDVVGSGTPWSGDISGTRNDGVPFQASVVVSPIREPGDEPSGYVVVARDVTEERRYEETARQQARERALIAETIRAIDSHGTADEIATAICRQVAGLPEVELAALFVFASDGEAVPSGSFMPSGQEPPRLRLPVWRATYLREQCKRGPWIEAWRANPDHPYNTVFEVMGVRATAFAPVRDGKDVVGFLIINSSVDNAEQQLAEALPALVEFAEITSTVLGARLADRTINDAALASLASVIALHAFHPVYQPIVDVEIGRIVGYEGLTRFEDGTDPETRFQLAAALGMSRDLEMAAFKAIIEGADSLQSDAWLNVNLSPAVISSAPELAGIIAASERRIVIEVTEHEAIDDYAAFRDAMHRLGPRVRLAVDDAGAGFASMRHIVELRPDYVKLDRAVIAGINRDEARRALAVGMRQFARTAGFWLIAEGVETAAELRTLREIDIHYIQGYLVGRPATAEVLLSAAQPQNVPVKRR